ncbi:MAG: cytochrome C biogenesis protein [Cytophagales bacterium]|nr:MAG: cytochrome C biogenesis protein [Cytophagales bacterium]
MTHTTIGDIGHASIVISFIAAIIAAFSYWKASSAIHFLEETSAQKSWRIFARFFFYIHSIGIVGVVSSLFLIIKNHYYEYHYAWDHSSNSLPIYYMISSFWEGQEGSFLLWLFWHMILGLILIHQNKIWESPMMAVFCAVQAFLAYMILGSVLPVIDLKLGSSPFILLKDFMGALPVYKINPDYIPEDGTGLNPLLQNYWMVIHPPTLFLGFATTLIPFAYCIAGIWMGRYREWIRPALPWALFSAMVLGTGILMGGYWAYETLNFGGYWNWDPVENAVYVPWLVLVASIHTMITFKNSSTALRSTIILTISTFVLILYSTFLTRSGILGNASVHSFTDLGLSGQLLVYLLAFLFLSLALLVYKWKEIPSTEKEASIYSREFWIFVGATVLCLAGFQVLATTSIPVYNAILGLFGIKSNIAPPADQMEHYSKFQIWAGIAIAILSAIGQYFWWKKIDGKTLWDTLALPVLISMLSSMAIIYFTHLDHPIYILLATVSVFSVVANGFILYGILKSNYKLSGGAIAHIGVALMLIGILYSSGYSKVISQNNSGMTYSKEFSEEMNKENILLWRNDPEQMDDFTLLYKGQRLESPDFNGYINKDDILPLNEKSKVIAKKAINYKDKVYYKKGDTITIIPENTFYEVLYTKPNGDTFTLYPRAQVNPQMGLLASPDIKRFWGRDLYSFVSSIPIPDKEREWNPIEEHQLRIGDTVFLNDFVAVLRSVNRETNIPGILLGESDVAVKAHFRILGGNKNYDIYPLYIVLIKDQMVGQIPEIVEDLGVKITFLNINPTNGVFTFGVNTTQKDYIILKAIEKPAINILWLGTLLLIIGLIIAILRRYTEFIKMRVKGTEV